MAGSTKKVAIMVPFSNRSDLTNDEWLSIRHLRHYLGKYDKYALVPPDFPRFLPDFNFLPFDQKYFGSAENHKKLLFSKKLYQAFSDYEYILTYHLDALVFSDQLEHWCDRGYDFVGPPWVKHQDAPYAGQEVFENKVGNGGFCLKRVRTFLRVLQSERKAIDVDEYWNRTHSKKNLVKKVLNRPKKDVMRFPAFNNIRWELDRWRHSEERFWVERGSHYDPDFRIAPLKEALAFGFEAVPRYCFELNGGVLPFGCHAWHRYDPSFWEPYLLREPGG